MGVPAGASASAPASPPSRHPTHTQTRLPVLAEAPADVHCWQTWRVPAPSPRRRSLAGTVWRVCVRLTATPEAPAWLWAAVSRAWVSVCLRVACQSVSLRASPAKSVLDPVYLNVSEGGVRPSSASPPPAPPSGANAAAAALAAPERGDLVCPCSGDRPTVLSARGICSRAPSRWLLPPHTHLGPLFPRLSPPWAHFPPRGVRWLSIFPYVTPHLRAPCRSPRTLRWILLPGRLRPRVPCMWGLE